MHANDKLEDKHGASSGQVKLQMILAEININPFRVSPFTLVGNKLYAQLPFVSSTKCIKFPWFSKGKSMGIPVYRIGEADLYHTLINLLQWCYQLWT